MFAIQMTDPAAQQFAALQSDKGLAKRFKAVCKALKLLANNPRHPGLNTHAWKSSKCPHGDTLWEAYAENGTPAAYRIFFCYPPNQNGVILIASITAHP